MLSIKIAVFLIAFFQHIFAAFIPEPTQIIRTQVTTFNYGGFGKIKTVEEISKYGTADRMSSSRFRRNPLQDSSSSELFKNDPDPFAVPEVETYPVEDSRQSSISSSNFINQQDPRVQEVDVVGWFE